MYNSLVTLQVYIPLQILLLLDFFKTELEYTKKFNNSYLGNDIYIPLIILLPKVNKFTKSASFTHLGLILALPRCEADELCQIRYS